MDIRRPRSIRSFIQPVCNRHPNNALRQPLLDGVAREGGGNDLIVGERDVANLLEDPCLMGRERHSGVRKDYCTCT